MHFGDWKRPDLDNLDPSPQALKVTSLLEKSCWVAEQVIWSGMICVGWSEEFIPFNHMDAIKKALQRFK